MFSEDDPWVLEVWRLREQQCVGCPTPNEQLAGSGSGCEAPKLRRNQWPELELQLWSNNPSGIVHVLDPSKRRRISSPISSL
ncbi:unnamed protein product [Linum trigynum]|uniref:Uncharacterized protein n=1 Tax=Linum trigynum TaxID=586398 RepID=A0AAV2CGB7_9ROSI